MFGSAMVVIILYCIYVCIKSTCCVPDTYITLYVNYISINLGTYGQNFRNWPLYLANLGVPYLYLKVFLKGLMITLMIKIARFGNIC